MNRVELLNTLDLVSNALSDNNLVPVFSCFCFQDETVSAFNDEIAVVAACPWNGTPFAVHGKTLLGLVKHGSTEEIDFVVRENDVTVKSGKSIIKLPYFPEDQFVFKQPKIGEGANLIFGEVSRVGMEQCLTTVSHDLTQAALLGIFLKGTTMYSCDGDAITRYGKASNDKNGYMLPTKFCETLLKIQGAGTLIGDKHWAQVVFNDKAVYGRVIDNPNPLDHESTIKKTIKGEPTFVPVTTLLKAALSRAWVIAEPDRAPTMLEVTGNKLTLTTTTPMGDVRDTIPFQHHDVTAKVSAALVQRSVDVCDEMAICENATVYRRGEHVLQLVANMR